MGRRGRHRAAGVGLARRLAGLDRWGGGSLDRRAGADADQAATMSGVLVVLPQIARLEALDTTEIPVESEMPGAAVLAVVGIVLEVARLITGG